MSVNASAVQLNKLRAIGAGSVAHQQRRDDVFRLEDAARTMAQCRDLLITIALDMGMTGDTAEAAKNSLLALQKTTSQQVGHLSEASNAASMAHIAVNHAAAAIADLPETGLTPAQTATLKKPLPPSDNTGGSTVSGSGGEGFDLAKEKFNLRKQQATFDSTTDAALNTLNSGMASAQTAMPSTSQDYQFGGVPPTTTTVAASLSGSATSGPAAGPSAAHAGTGGSRHVSHPAIGASAGSGAAYGAASGSGSAYGVTSGTGSTYGAASADGSMVGSVPGSHTSSGMGGSGSFGTSGSGAGSGALAGGLAVGGAALGASALGRAGGMGGLAGGGIGGMGGGMGGGLGRSIGSGSRGFGANATGAGSRAGSGNELNGTAGSRGAGSGSGIGSANGEGAGSQAGGTKGGMPMGGGGAGGGGGKKERRGSGSYLVPNLRIADDEAVVALGDGAKAGSRSQLAAAPAVPLDDFEPEDTW